MDGSGWEGGEWVSKVGIYEAIYDIFFHVWVFFRNGGPSPIFFSKMPLHRMRENMPSSSGMDKRGRYIYGAHWTVYDN